MRKIPTLQVVRSVGMAQKTANGRTLSMKREFKILAELLIQLQRTYPWLFADVSPDDPDLDMDRGFKTYDELEKLANGRRLNKIQQ